MANEAKNMKKIVLMEKFGQETQQIQFVNKVVLESGDTEEDRGYENSTPTYFHRVEGVNKYFCDGEIYFAGNIFKEHFCNHKEIRVFCNTEIEYGKGVENTSAIIKFLNANFIKVCEESNNA